MVFSHVGLTYAGAGEESLTDIDFTVKKGETVGIIGGTGSGKSSVVNLIPRFYDATKGSVQIGGKDVREYSLEELRGKIGMVLQKAVLFKGTIRENIDVYKRQERGCDKSIWNKRGIGICVQQSGQGASCFAFGQNDRTQH